METKKLFEQISNVYQASQVLHNLKAAFYMHDLSSCETLIAFYRKLHEDRVADELCFWCKDECEQGLLARIDKEYFRLCSCFQGICTEMQARFAVGADAWNEDLLIAFSKVFWSLGYNLQMHVALAEFVKINVDFWKNIQPDVYEAIVPIFRSMVGYGSLSVFLSDFLNELEKSDCSEEH